MFAQEWHLDHRLVRLRAAVVERRGVGLKAAHPDANLVGGGSTQLGRPKLIDAALAARRGAAHHSAHQVGRRRERPARVAPTRAAHELFLSRWRLGLQLEASSLAVALALVRRVQPMLVDAQLDERLEARERALLRQVVHQRVNVAIGSHPQRVREACGAATRDGRLVMHAAEEAGRGVQRRRDRPQVVQIVPRGRLRAVPHAPRLRHLAQ